MTKTEIAQVIAHSHNCLANIMVSGDNAILMGEVLKEMRLLIQGLYRDIEQENNNSEAENDEKAAAGRDGETYEYPKCLHPAGA